MSTKSIAVKIRSLDDSLLQLITSDLQERLLMALQLLDSVVVLLEVFHHSRSLRVDLVMPIDLDILQDAVTFHHQ